MTSLNLSISCEMNHPASIGGRRHRSGIDRPNPISALNRSSSRIVPGMSANATTTTTAMPCSVDPCSDNNDQSIRYRRRLRVNRPDPYPNRISPFNRSSSRRGQRISANVTTTAAVTPCSVDPYSDNNEILFSVKLDEWMRDSAAEIVKNLREAPLLVQVYAGDDGAAARLETEKAIAAEDWTALTRRWKDGEAQPPDGVILVEEIGGEGDLEEEDGTRAWGIVVQGKGVERGPVCYLMKTSRVGSGLGLGCTHFCLVKAQSFTESALSQLANCWLLE